MNAYHLNDFTAEVEKELRREAFKQNYYYENKYLQKYNETCPLCNKNIKPDRRNILNKIGSVGMISLEEKRVCLSYALCKQCSKKLSKYNQVMKKECENKITSHILSKLK